MRKPPNSVLDSMQPDVEALLVDRIDSTPFYCFAPIDVCFELAGAIRKQWRGLSGGDEESKYRMPVSKCREMMEAHYPNRAWLYSERDVVDRLCDYKRRHGLTTWDQTIGHLLPVRRREGTMA